MFSDIIGHDEIIKNLKNVLISGRIANGYIFAGPPQVGKEFLAFSFAKALNCTEIIGDFCDRCVSCRRINDGNHTDISIIRPEGSRLKIDQMRFLKKQSSYKALEGSHKIYIIDDAEKMTPESANSMLKTLEEPSGVVLFILLTTAYNSILPTIRSRCQLVRFSLVPPTAIQSKIADLYEITEAKAKWIAGKSQGKPGKAVKMAKESNENPDDDLSFIISILTQRNKDHLLDVFKKAEDIGKSENFIDDILSWYRDILLVKNSCDKSILTHSDNFELLQEISKPYSAIQIENLIDMMLKLRRLIQRNINSTLAMEIMLFNIYNVLSTRL